MKKFSTTCPWCGAHPEIRVWVSGWRSGDNFYAPEHYNEADVFMVEAEVTYEADRHICKAVHNRAGSEDLSEQE